MNGERDGYKWKHTCRHKMSKGERKQGMSLKTKTNTNTKSRCQNKLDFSLCNFGKAGWTCLDEPFSSYLQKEFSNTNISLQFSQ